jgi:hypothetical protein
MTHLPSQQQLTLGAATTGHMQTLHSSSCVSSAVSGVCQGHVASVVLPQHTAHESCSYDWADWVRWNAKAPPVHDRPLSLSPSTTCSYYRHNSGVCPAIIKTLELPMHSPGDCSSNSPKQALSTQWLLVDKAGRHAVVGAPALCPPLN